MISADRCLIWWLGWHPDVQERCRLHLVCVQVLLPVTQWVSGGVGLMLLDSYMLLKLSWTHSTGAVDPGDGLRRWPIALVLMMQVHLPVSRQATWASVLLDECWRPGECAGNFILGRWEYEQSKFCYVLIHLCNLSHSRFWKGKLPLPPFHYTWWREQYRNAAFPMFEKRLFR